MSDFGGEVEAATVKHYRPFTKSLKDPRQWRMNTPLPPHPLNTLATPSRLRWHEWSRGQPSQTGSTGDPRCICLLWLIFTHMQSVREVSHQCICIHSILRIFVACFWKIPVFTVNNKHCREFSVNWIEWLFKEILILSESPDLYVEPRQATGRMRQVEIITGFMFCLQPYPDYVLYIYIYIYCI